MEHPIVVLYHVTVALIYAASLLYNILYVNEEGGNTLTYKGYGGKFKFLTFWNFVSHDVVQNTAAKMFCLLIGLTGVICHRQEYFSYTNCFQSYEGGRKPDRA